jgi:hypothetical protein
MTSVKLSVSPIGNYHCFVVSRVAAGYISNLSLQDVAEPCRHPFITLKYHILYFGEEF